MTCHIFKVYLKFWQYQSSGHLLGDIQDNRQCYGPKQKNPPKKDNIRQNITQKAKVFTFSQHEGANAMIDYLYKKCLHPAIVITIKWTLWWNTYLDLKDITNALANYLKLTQIASMRLITDFISQHLKATMPVHNNGGF
jgi:hypothetical protein